MVEEAVAMKLGFLVIVAALTTSVSTAAQDRETKSRTRIVVEDGKEMTVTGCLRQSADGSFTLTDTAGRDGAMGSYLLAVSDDEDDLDDLRDHLGHRLEISGKAADRGDGRIRVETRNETRKADGGKAKTESTSEVKGDLTGLPYLGMKSFRMIATVCP
jgi:hypothetical protein